MCNCAVNWCDKLCFFAFMFNNSGQLASREDVVVCLQSFCSNGDVNRFKRLAVLRTLEQVGTSLLMYIVHFSTLQQTEKVSTFSVWHLQRSF